MNPRRILSPYLSIFLVFFLLSGCISVQPEVPPTEDSEPTQSTELPADIQAIMDKDMYQDATWGLRILDTNTDEVLYDLNSDQPMLIGSVRKLFSVGVALEELGASHQFVTRVHGIGDVDTSGVLEGDLILVASGDFSMGMRRQADGTMAISDLDHNDGFILGNAILTDTDARFAYRQLAQDVAAAGITAIAGEIMIDDHLFQPFEFRQQYQVTPAIVNDNLVDVSASPTAVGEPAQIETRPDSAAFTVNSNITTVAGDGVGAIELDEFVVECIGTPGCNGTITGELPIDGAPAMSEEYPVVQSFRIGEPNDFARTVFIEELQNAGIDVAAALVAPNPADQLPPASAYSAENELAVYESLSFSEYVKLVLKISFNLGADLSLIHFGLSQGANNMTDALAAERLRLTSEFGVRDEDFTFYDGSGGTVTSATTRAVTTMLQEMKSRPTADIFEDALPLLGVDGTSGLLAEYKNEPSLVGATGQVQTKTGTYATGTPEGLISVDARAMAGYIQTQSGRDVTFVVIVNNAGTFDEFLDTIAVYEDVGTITAILWRDY